MNIEDPLKDDKLYSKKHFKVFHLKIFKHNAELEKQKNFIDLLYAIISKSICLRFETNNIKNIVTKNVVQKIFNLKHKKGFLDNLNFLCIVKVVKNLVLELL